MRKAKHTVHQIELRIARLSALFNSMDPTPFHQRDLDRDAVEYLENWALEYSQQSHFCIIVHIDDMPESDPAPLVSEAIGHYFEYKSTLARRSLRRLLVEGRISLLIGLAFLALCLLGADMLASYVHRPFPRMLKESLLIGGWVAMWRPIQIFLYEWWPIVRKRRIYRNLGNAKVHVMQAKRQAAA